MTVNDIKQCKIAEDRVCLVQLDSGRLLTSVDKTPLRVECCNKSGWVCLLYSLLSGDCDSSSLSSLGSWRLSVGGQGGRQKKLG